MTLLRRTYKLVCSLSRECCLKQICYSFVKNRIRLYSTEIEAAVPKKTVRSMKNKHETDKMPVIAWPLLVIPVAAFGLGTWQIQRKSWKENLIKELKERTNTPPKDFPDDLDELKNMEYHPVRVKGKFHHEREIYLGPRSRYSQKSQNTSSLLSTSKAGFLVITPFTLTDKNITILVNRGWVPAHKKLPNTRGEGQITGEVEFIGLVRHSVKKQPLGMRNIPEDGFWSYLDLEEMAKVTGAAPILIDADKNSTVHGGPIGGQTVVGLRNEHLSYIFTWYTLSGLTGFLWYNHFWKYIKR